MEVGVRITVCSTLTVPVGLARTGLAGGIPTNSVLSVEGSNCCRLTSRGCSCPLEELL